jgi:hypothetical protein
VEVPKSVLQRNSDVFLICHERALAGRRSALHQRIPQLHSSSNLAGVYSMCHRLAAVAQSISPRGISGNIERHFCSCWKEK